MLYVALDDPRVGPLADIEEDAGSVAGNVLDVLCAEAVQTGAILTITPALHLSVLTLRDPLRLLDLRGSWSQLTRVGTHLSTATHRSVQPWARAIRTTYPDLHGVLYVPATGGRAVAAALNESSSPMLATASLVASRPLGDLADLGILGDAAERVGIVLERVDRTG